MSGSTGRGARLLALAGGCALSLAILGPVTSASAAPPPVTSVKVGEDIGALAVDSADNLIFAADSTQGSVQVINGATNAVTAPQLVCSDPSDITFDPVSDVAYVLCPTDPSNSNDSEIVALNTSDQLVGTPIVIPSSSSDDSNAMTVDPTTGDLYVANIGNDSVTVISGTSVVQTITNLSTFDPNGLAVDHGTSTLWISAADNGVESYNLTSDADNSGSPVTVGNDPDAIVADTSTDTVYVANSGDGDVTAINGSTDAVQGAQIEVTGTNDPELPSLALGSSALYVLASETGQIYSIDIGASSPTASLLLTLPSDTAQSMAFDSVTDVLYVADYDGTVQEVYLDGSAPAFTSTFDTTFAAGTAGSFTITASGSPLPAITESGKLPSGVTFTAGANGTATLSGTPAAGTSGDYPITLTATSIVGTPAQQAFSLFVDEVPAITSAASATFTAGSAGSFTVTATGYPSPAITESGALPGGVTLHSNGDGTATLSGTPSAAGSFPITISASNGVGSAAIQSFTLTVTGGTPSPPTLPPTETVTATPGKKLAINIKAKGNPPPKITEKGTLPAGLKFKAESGGRAMIYGTVSKKAKAGRYKVKLTAHNGHGKNATEIIWIKVK
jgi:hypothetical protein